MTRRRAGATAAAAAAAFIMTAATAVTWAQAPPGGGGLNAAEKELGITAAQKSRITALRTKYQPQIQKIDKKYQPRVMALRKQMADLQKQYVAEVKPIASKMDKEMEAILTPAQRTKIKQMQAAQRQQQMGGGR